MITPATTVPDAPRTISHAELMQLPMLRYEGPIHLATASEDALQGAWRAIRRERVLGFDTETQPTFRKGQSHPPSLIQIATADAVYLFQPRQLDCSHVIASVMGNAHIVKAGVALSRDLLDLQKLFPITPMTLLDLGDVAKHLGFTQTGVRNLTGLLLGGRITKGARTSNWARSHLNPSQLRYAATDAWVCRELYRYFEQRGMLAHLPQALSHGHTGA